MPPRDSLRLVSFFSLFLIVVAGTFLALRATPEGLGLSDDSIAYIAGARSLLAGDGYREAWLATNGYVTHFPPGFPSALTFLGWFGLDPLRGARFLNAILFGLNAGLVGILVWRTTPSLTAGLIAAGLFVLNGEMLQVHAVAMSEPLFIFFSLVSLWTFDLSFESLLYYAGEKTSEIEGRLKRWRRRNESSAWLIASGVCAGLAYLTRYSGLALVAALLVALIILHTSWRKRLGGMILFLEGFIPLAAVWALRNHWVAGNATNRSLAWHPLTQENIETGLRVFADFSIPVTGWFKALAKAPGVFEAIAVLILGGALVWTALEAWKFFTKQKQPSLREGSGFIIPLITGLFLFAYLASTVASMTLFDAATKFKLRIVAPVFVCLFILLVCALIWLRKRNFVLATLIAVAALGASFFKQVNTVNTWSKSGLGFASFQWYDSEAMTFLRELPEDVAIFTNEPGAVYLYTGRGALVLPSGYDSARAESIPGFEEGVERMQAEINAGRAVLAIFDDGANIAGEVDALTEGLNLAQKSQGDSIYTHQP
ncbi:MAG TPA: phospholipid carrier-dependent glycosyltransferase [Anaerolineales bacterium]|nr:phospholipid carrier-dependent glycosyltransferase [Anaerolineales bacterium]